MMIYEALSSLSVPVCHPPYKGAEDTYITYQLLGQSGQIYAEGGEAETGVQFAVSIFAVGFAADLTIIEEYDPSLPPTFADPDQLMQVFLNLIRNAAEAIGRARPAGGHRDGRPQPDPLYPRRRLQRRHPGLPGEAQAALWAGQLMAGPWRLGAWSLFQTRYEPGEA